MIFYPALDLLDGMCVRLQKGDYQQKTIYSDNPVGMVLQFKSLGTKWLHVVDLNGAKEGRGSQEKLIKEIVERSGLKVQVGGGIRSIDQAKKYIDHGAERIILGSIAVKDIPLTKTMLKTFGEERVVLALDGKANDYGNINGKDFILAIHGWQKESGISLFEILETYKGDGLKHILCTDISRDGMMVGPNIELYRHIKDRHESLSVIASGGISSFEDIVLLEQNGIDGAVAGKAIYEGKINLKEVFECLPKE